MTFLKRYSNSAVALNFFTSCMVSKRGLRPYCMYLERWGGGGAILYSPGWSYCGLSL